MVEEIVVSSRDRLCRFAFELLQWIFDRNGTKVTVLQQGDVRAYPESELSDDVLSIIQVFCCRRNGKRRYRTSENGESPGIPTGRNENAKAEAPTVDPSESHPEEMGGGLQPDVQFSTDLLAVQSSE